jgi:hypothetical protein
VSVRALGYPVLCAAEIEHYLEDRCAEIAKTALDSWKTRAATSTSLVSLTMFSGIKLETPPAYLNARPKDQRAWDDLVSPAQRIERCVDKYVDFATKELVVRMDAFGALRGDAAHLSTLRAIRTKLDALLAAAK